MRGPIAIHILIPFIFMTGGLCQVRMKLPKASFKPGEKIEVNIVNDGAAAITYCIEFGQSSQIEHNRESTPIPFYVERHEGRKWNVLLIGPDVGNSIHSALLEASRSQSFYFSLLDKGKMRLILRYWDHERDAVCSHQGKGMHTIMSRVFSVVGD